MLFLWKARDKVFGALFAGTLLLARFLGRHCRRLAEGLFFASLVDLFAAYFLLNVRGRLIAASSSASLRRCLRVRSSSKTSRKRPSPFPASQEASELASTLSGTGSSPDDEWMGVERRVVVSTRPAERRRELMFWE